jgi:hypothetical protein
MLAVSPATLRTLFGVVFLRSLPLPKREADICGLGMSNETENAVQYIPGEKRQVTEILKTEISSLVDRQRSAGRKAADAIMETLEVTVRLGWRLRDLSKELTGVSGTLEAYCERNLPISYRQAQRYMKGSRLFQRDHQDFEFQSQLRRQVGLPELAPVKAESPLRDQIIALNANSFAEVLRLSGLSKSKVQTLSPPRSERPLFLRVGKSISMSVVRLNRALKLEPLENWGTEERKAVLADLQPLLELADKLRDSLNV